MKEVYSVFCYSCGTGHNLGQEKTEQFYEDHKAKGHLVELVKRTERERKTV